MKSRISATFSYLSFNGGVEIGQVLALTVVPIPLGYWRTHRGFLRHAFATNAALIVGWIHFTGYQLAGYWVSGL
jgi:hypothetical protein